MNEAAARSVISPDSPWAELVEMPSARGELLHVGSSGEYSGHAIDTFSCPARYAFKYKLNALEPDPNQPVKRTASMVARVRGSLAHQGVGLHYRRMMARQKGENPDQFAQPLDGIVRMGRNLGGMYLEEVEIVLEVVSKYLDTQRGESVQVMGVEFVVNMAPWLGGRAHTRSIDLIVTDASGLVFFVDHKFTKRECRRYIDSLTMDGQMLDYAIIGRELYGDRFGGCWGNVGRWPDPGAWVPRKEPEFLRDQVDPAPWAVSHRAWDLQWKYNQRDQLVDAGLDPWRWPCSSGWNNCEAGSGCDAKELCRFGPSRSPQYNAVR